MSKKSIAVVCNTGLGDGVIFERVHHAFVKLGYLCTLYSPFLLKLKVLYPGADIRPYPSDIESKSSLFWQHHSSYFFQEYAPGSHMKLDDEHLKCLKYGKRILGESYRKQNQSWQGHIVDTLRSLDLDVKSPLSSSLTPLPSWEKRKYKRRILIHPTSLKEQKNWPQGKFLALANELEKRGYDVWFCATEPEKESWDEPLVKAGLKPMLALDLVALSKFIYESDYFVGNDSGVAHVAPALGIPSLKIFDRASRASFWSGGWLVGREVLPFPLPTRFLRVYFWKNFLPVGKVLCAFEKLACEYP